MVSPKWNSKAIKRLECERRSHQKRSRLIVLLFWQGEDIPGEVINDPGGISTELVDVDKGTAEVAGALTLDPL